MLFMVLFPYIPSLVTHRQSLTSAPSCVFGQPKRSFFQQSREGTWPSLEGPTIRTGLVAVSVLRQTRFSAVDNLGSQRNSCSFTKTSM